MSKHLWVYLGQFEGQTIPIVERFQEIDEQETKVGAPFAYKKFRKALTPGAIYYAEVEKEGSIAESKVGFSGKLISDEEWLTEIQLQHKTFLGRKRLKALEGKYRKEFDMSTDLQKLAIQYRSLYGMDRQIFEWMVLTKLRELAGRA